MSNTVAAIIQARMGSTRLPGKSLMLLAGKPLVGRVIERIRTATKIDKLILAIPDNIENNPLETLGKSYGVQIFRGSEIDLVDRYYNAAKNLSCKYVVRIPADNPVPQGSEIDRIIDHHLSLNRPGFSSNLAEIYGSRYPDGIGAEIFDFELLYHPLYLSIQNHLYLHHNQGNSNHLEYLSKAYQARFHYQDHPVLHHR